MKMKYHILLFLIISFFVQACNDDDSGMQERNDLKLTASSESIVLDINKQNETVITFSWDKATDIGSEYTFSYLFQIDIADNDFASATDYVTLDENGSFSFTASELYELIVEKWRGAAGQEITIEARVAAKVDGPKFVYPEIATTKIQVTTYVLESQPLFIVGTATDGGLDPTKSIQMTELANGSLYEWTGKLNVGSFKFITTQTDLYPAYEKGESDGTMVFQEEPGQSENYFEITEAGTYYIYLSRKSMTVAYSRSQFEALYIVGDGCDAGWEFTTTMVQDKLNLSIYTYSGALKAGELKIIAGTNWEDPTFRPLVANGSIESEEVQFVEGGDDLKWKVTEDQAGEYLITLDVDLPKITFEKQ